MTNRYFEGLSEQRRAGVHRLEDARGLLGIGRWRGSMYLAGYAIECLLKSKLMGIFGCRNLSELEVELRRRGRLAAGDSIYSHRLERMLGMADRLGAIKANGAVWRKFTIANLWLPSWRYNPDPASQAEAGEFVSAVEVVVVWIEANA